MSGPTLSVGFAPGAQPNPGGSGWVNPIGTCFLHRYVPNKMKVGPFNLAGACFFRR